jgi:hypothetical protein
MTVCATTGNACAHDCPAGNVGKAPFALGQYAENTGDEASSISRQSGVVGSA